MVTSQRGRPSSFDREIGLRQAMLAFWEHGYEGVSIADLTEIMGIRPPSLYAAYGNKQALFDLAVEMYRREVGGYGARAIAETSTSYDGVERLLDEAAGYLTLQDHPRGCLIIEAATNCTNRSSDVAVSLQRRRDETFTMIHQAIAADIASGVLPSTTDAKVLATYAVAVLQGMSHQARDGASQDTLENVAAVAMRAWPRSP